MFGTLQGRWPQECRLAGIAEIELANLRLSQVPIPERNARFAVPAMELGTVFVPCVGRDLGDVLCLHEERTTGNNNRVA